MFWFPYVATALLAGGVSAQVQTLNELTYVTSSNGALQTTFSAEQFFYDNTDLGVKYWTRAFNPDHSVGMSHILQTGPVLQFKRGDTVQVTLNNNLGEETMTDEEFETAVAAGTMSINSYHFVNKTNLHTHGLHVTAEDPQDNVMKSISPLDSHAYIYSIPDDHAGGTFWYHAHHHGSTAIQVGGGLIGAIIVEDEPEDLPAGLYGIPEVVMVMAHVPFTQLSNIVTTTGDDLSNHADNELAQNSNNDYIFVNGQYQATVEIPTGKWHRVRMVYSSLTSSIRLSMTENSANCEWHLLAKDGIYVDEAPRPLGVGTTGTGTVYMGPGNRVDVVMRCANAGSMALGSTGVDDTDMEQTQILSFDISDDGTVADPDLARFHPYRPDYLANVFDTTNAVVQQSVAFNGGGGSCTINGQAWQGGASGTENGQLETGSIQEWTVNGNDRHPFHLHVNSYQLKTVSGIDDGFYAEGDWHDVLLSPGALNIGQYVFSVDTFVTKSVLHCHFLTHEDLGCMGFFQHIDNTAGVVTGLSGNSMSCTGGSTGTATFSTDCLSASFTIAPTVAPTLVPTVQGETTAPTHAPTTAPTLAPTPADSPMNSDPPTGDFFDTFTPQIVEFGNLTTVAGRRNIDEWMGDGVHTCHDATIKAFNVLSMKTIIQSPSAEMVNIVLHVQHRKQSIMRDKAFLRLTLMSKENNMVVFHREQNLFENSLLLTHFVPPVDITSNEVVGDLKIGVQVNFFEEDISPFDMSFSAILEIGVYGNAADDTSTMMVPRVYDCVQLYGVGVTGSGEGDWDDDVDDTPE